MNSHTVRLQLPIARPLLLRRCLMFRRGTQEYHRKRALYCWPFESERSVVCWDAVSMYTLRLLCTRFEWTNVASALNRSDASSWELRVVVSLGAPSSAHSLRSARHSSGPSAHYNA